LRRDGVTVIAAQVGTQDGGLIPLPGGTFVKDRSGSVVKSRSSHATLQKLAPDVVNLGAAVSGLKPMVERVRSESRESVSQQRRHKQADRYQYPLAVACLLFSFLLLPRRRARI